MRALLIYLVTFFSIDSAAQCYCCVTYSRDVRLVKIGAVDSVWVKAVNYPGEIVLLKEDKDYLINVLSDTTGFRNGPANWYPPDIRLYLFRGDDLRAMVLVSEKHNSIMISGVVSQDYEGGPNEWKGQITPQFKEKFAALLCKIGLRE